MTTLTTATWFDAGTTHSRRSVSTDAASGQVVRRQVQSSHSRNSSEKEVRSWSAVWKHATPDEYAHIDSVYDASMAGAFTISWRPPDLSAAIDVYFTAYNVVHTSGRMYQISAQFEEAI